jgi:hypothetical protein
MSLWYNKGNLASWLWCAIIAIVSRARYESAIKTVNKQKNIRHNKKDGITGFLLYAIIIIGINNSANCCSEVSFRRNINIKKRKNYNKTTLNFSKLTNLSEGALIVER